MELPEIHRTIERSVGDPAAAARLRLAVANDPRVVENWQVLLNEVDISPCGLNEWMEAVACVLAHADRQQRELAFAQAVGYIACCNESQAANPVKLPLPDLAEDMLEQYGVA